MSSNSKPRRVIVWALPRTTSTALLKSITSRCDIKGYFEPFGAADWYGPEGSLKEVHQGLEEPEYTFDAVKGWLEAELKSDRSVFVKDIAYAIQGRHDKLPKGYQHAFLIRNPEKVFKSFYKLFISSSQLRGESLHDWLPKKLSLYQCMAELVVHVESAVKSDICIIDSDDIVKNPAEMIEKFCRKVGFNYTTEMLQWKPGIPGDWCISKSFLASNQWFESTASSTGWVVSRTKSDVTDETTYPDYLTDMIEQAIPFYEKIEKSS